MSVCICVCKFIIYIFTIQMMVNFPYLIIAPIEMIIIFCFLYQFYGVSMVVGYALLFIVVPLQGVLGDKFKKYRFIYIYIKYI